MKKTLFLLGCSIGALGYQTEGSVLKLGESDFDAALNEYPHVLVKFFAPWCGHCKNLAQTYLDAAEALQEAGSTVKLAEVDCTIHKQLCQKHGIRGYPTVNFFSKGTEAPQKYSSSRTKQAIVSWLTEKVPIVKSEEQQEAVDEQAKEEETKEDETQEQAQQQRQEQFKREQQLYQLTTQTFSTAKERFDYLFVKFFAPWCGHCIKMKETWIQFANSNQDSKVAIAEVDCTQNQPVCSENGVQGYPTLKLLVRGNEPVKYQGARTIEAFSAWFQDQKTKLIPLPDSAPEVQAQEL